MRGREAQHRRPITIKPRRSVEVTAPRPKAEEWIPKRTYLRKHVELAKYEFTNQCLGRKSAQTGAKNRAHNEDCRKSIEDRTQDDNEH